MATQFNHFANLSAATSTGKLPSTKQTNAWIDWILKGDLVKATGAQSGGQLSEKGKPVIEDLRGLLEAWKAVGEHKNADDQVQEFLYHTAATDASATASANTEKLSQNTSVPVSKDELQTDEAVIRSSLRTLFDLLSSLSPELASALGQDYGHFFRQNAADAAESLEATAREVKENLRDSDEKARRREKGERIEGERNLEERNMKETFEDRMDYTKEKGAYGIEKSQKAKEKTEQLGNEGKQILVHRLKHITRQSRESPEFKQSLTSLLDLIRKWSRVKPTETSVSDPSFSLDTVADPSGHLRPSLSALDTLYSRFTGGGSFSELLGAGWAVLRDIEDSPRLKEFYDRGDAYLRRLINDPDYAENNDSTEDGQRLVDDWNELVRETREGEEQEKWQKDARKLQELAERDWRNFTNDKDVLLLKEANVKLTKSAGEWLGFAGLEGAKQAATNMEVLKLAFGDVLDVLLPRVFALVQSIPIPRTEYVSPEADFVMENIDLASVQILPGTVRISTTVDLTASKTTTDQPGQINTSQSGTINIRGGQFTAKDVSYWVKIKEGGVPMMKGDSGIADIELAERGFDATISYRLSTKQGTKRQTFYDIESVNVDLHDFDLVVRQNKHKILSSLFKGTIRSAVGKAFEQTLQQYLWLAFDMADRIAWDTKKRADVFKDTGLGDTASWIGAVKSELGYLAKQTSILEGVQVTNLGIIKDDPASNKAFAVGGGPQLISGDKHGPLAGSTTTTHAGGTGPNVGSSVDAKERAEGAAKQGTQKVQSWKNTVMERREQEKRKEGWRSDAFDL